MAENHSFWHDGQRGNVLTTMATAYATALPKKRAILTKEFVKTWCTRFAEDVESMGSCDALQSALITQIQIHADSNNLTPRRRMPPHWRRAQEITFVGSRQGTADEVRQARRRRQEQRSSPYGLSRYGEAIINIDDPLPDAEDIVLIKSGRRTAHQANATIAQSNHRDNVPTSGNGSHTHPYIL